MDKISALMDGELDARQSEQQYSRLKHDADARASWGTYHLIGDALRGEGVFTRKLSGHLDQLSVQLSQEPTVLAPQRKAAKRPAATFAWSIAASLSAVALVGWVAVNNPLAPQSDEVRPVAVAPTPTPLVAVADQLDNVPSEGKMNEYLMAHQEFSPSTTIQGLAPYIRSVSATTSKGRE